MANTGTIKIKGISRKRIQALAHVYRELDVTFDPVGDHELLLHEHIKELSHRLNALEVKDQEKNMLTFTSTEALAFQQLWQLPIPVDPLSGVVIRETVMQINKASLAPKRLVAGRV